MVRVSEKAVQDALEKYYCDLGYVVKREVNTPVGYIDLLVMRNLGLPTREKIIVEVKEHSSLKHAIGQLYAYKKYHTDATKLRCVYFDRHLMYKGIDVSYTTFNDIEFTCVNTHIDVNEIISIEEKIHPKEKKKCPNIEMIDQTSLENLKNLTLTSKSIQELSNESQLEQILLTGILSDEPLF